MEYDLCYMSQWFHFNVPIVKLEIKAEILLMNRYKYFLFFLTIHSVYKYFKVASAVY